LDCQVSEDPLIWVVDGLCEQRQVQQLKDVLSRQKLDNLKKTAACRWHWVMPHDASIGKEPVG
jgi:hypothetical protein